MSDVSPMPQASLVRHGNRGSIAGTADRDFDRGNAWRQH